MKEDVDIVCYCDNDKSKWGKIFDEKEVICPENIKEINFDYIIIASQFNDEIYNQLIEIGINQVKVLQFFKYIDSFWSYVEFDLLQLYNNRENVEGIITGISYAEKGINEKVLIKNFNKLTRHSQDLYYDYNLVNYAIDKYKEEMKNLKYVIISLSYYSFEYDMSLSAMKGKVQAYYKAIGKEHHLLDIDRYLSETENNEYIVKEVFHLDIYGYPKVKWNITSSDKKIDLVNEEYGKRQALLDCNKNYYETVKENTEILQKYLQLLKDNNIKPIIVVCPVSKYYSKYFLQSMKEEFYSIINKVKEQYSFQFLDYFNNKLFEDSDFYDVSHLNEIGAEKFTRILNKDIIWDTDSV
nr:D-alanyl-lipoteichoic acid biosynthesis protein DltD [Clostridium saccharoperbutylacetonicum]